MVNERRPTLSEWIVQMRFMMMNGYKLKNIGKELDHTVQQQVDVKRMRVHASRKKRSSQSIRLVGYSTQDGEITSYEIVIILKGNLSNPFV